MIKEKGIVRLVECTPNEPFEFKAVGTDFCSVNNIPIYVEPGVVLSLINWHFSTSPLELRVGGIVVAREGISWREALILVLVFMAGFVSCWLF